MQKKQDKIIISLSSKKENIKNTFDVIHSIIEQNVERDSYKILLILSEKEFKNIHSLPEKIRLLIKKKRVDLLFIKENLNNLKRTLITMKMYNNNPIIIINNGCLLPEGWLKMFIKDHSKYPNDAIAATIQYFYGQNSDIREFSEGFKGKKFGLFNHVTEMIFNFAIFNIDLGGILYPKNFFRNNYFYDINLYSKITNNSEEFWESAFIILEDKILRQSSKIFDYTKYLIDNYNYEDIIMENIKMLEQIKLSFIKIFLILIIL